MRESNRELHPTLTMQDYEPAYKRKSYTWESGSIKLLPIPISYSGTSTRGPQAETKIIAVYNCLIRAMNSIYNQHSTIQSQSTPKFVRYRYDDISVLDGAAGHNLRRQRMYEMVKLASVPCGQAQQLQL